MFVLKENRGTGVAQRLLYELESWATELGHTKVCLRNRNTAN